MKGEATRATILDAALKMASLEGLEALSIGRLAKSVGLSKSGLFAHFKSKQTLQLKVLDRAAGSFVELVVLPSLEKPRGLARIQALFENWIDWAESGDLPGGCVFLAAAAELDDRPGKLRDFLVKSQRDWLATLARACRIAQQEREIRADVDPDQFAFDLYGIMMSFHLYSRLLSDDRAARRARTAFERLLHSIE